MKHSCNASAAFFADPAVRIHQVVSGLPNASEPLVCQADFSSALSQLGMAIGARLMAAPAADAGCSP
jgi:hypothetical protein